MKRLLIAVASSSLLALTAPGLAAAQKSRCHHHAHHACAKSKHARHARVLTFGVPASVTSPNGSAAPAAPSTPAEPPETAGTVTSFTAGVLTITLKDGSTVSGKVTEASEIRCQSATAKPGEGDDHGDESSGGGGDVGAHEPGFGARGDDMSGGGGDDDEGAEGSPSACTTAALVPGAIVAEAELRISAAGAVWERVSLIA